MSQHDDSDFLARLIAPMLEQLQRIAAAGRGDCSIDELRAEAWIAAQTLREMHGATETPEDMRLQESVLRSLWRAIGRFANRTMRGAFRLDIDVAGKDGDASALRGRYRCTATETTDGARIFRNNSGNC